MIGGGSIGAGGIVRPFYNRTPGGVAGIARVFIATKTEDFGGNPAFDIPTGAVPAGALLLAAINYDTYFNAGDVLPTLVAGGGTFTLEAYLPLGADNVVGDSSFVVGGAPINDTVRWSWPGGDAPTQIAAVLIYVTGLATPALDKAATASGVGTNQDSGLTAATTVADEFVWGTIGTIGLSTDTVGAWQDGFTAGADAGTTGIQIKEGFRIVSATGQRRAQVTGASLRTWRSNCLTYKG